ncbi:MAG: T9SS type A sorting domain-containing protein [Bacteroidia bacterium]
MKKNLLFILLLIGSFANAQLQNINISNSAAFDGEPYLAVNPANHKNMVIAWMGITITGGVKVSIKTKASFDGGATWGSLNVKPHMSSTWGSADVSMAFRKDGVLFLSYIDYNASKDSGGVFCTKSTNGGVTWSTPVKVIDLHEDAAKKPLDRPWLVVDNSNTANTGMLYITTKPAPWVAPPCRPYMKFSADSGQTWSTLRFVDTTNYLVGSLIQAPMAADAVTADGAFCAVYPSYVASQSVYPKFYLAKSYNRSASFQYTTVITNPTSINDTNYKAGYRLAANPANAQQMAIAFDDGRNGDPDIFVTATNDGGATWSTPTRVNNDALGNGVGQDMPWADYNDTGDLLVTWRDRRNGSGTGFQQPFETFAAVSHNNGNSFANNVNLCTVLTPFDTILAQKGNDFMGCKLVGDTICATWGDMRTGKLNVFFAKTLDTASVGIVKINPEETDYLQVFPNPARDNFIVSNSLKGTKGLTLTIYDGTGKKVSEKNDPSENETASCKNYPAGIYYVKLQTGEYSFLKKLIVEK